jgi:hypothetical protein
VFHTIEAMATHTRKTAKRRSVNPAKSGRAGIRKKIAKLTPSTAELLEYARRNPIPESFWTDDRNPSKP